ncbi:MAG: LytTR family transcriptional regulator [Tepidanaerobacteraceae bacterium]|jgi:two-component system LytT family response regulator/two-component system response regulator LytT|nr:LytTR family transcriptional regulator [Tepidanaerobacteraceae bacterium]
MIAAVTQEGKTAFNCREEIIILEHNDIVLCSVNKKHVTIHTKTGDIYTFFGNLKEIEDRLKEKNFVRCHKSCLINADYIKRIANNLGAWEIEFNCIEEKAPLSRRGRKMIIERYLSENCTSC